MNEEVPALAVCQEPARRPRIALVLSGGGARGLAHIGVLDALARAGIEVDFVAGSSMGGLIGALHSSGLMVPELIAIARGFRFPRWFVPGALLGWEQVFPSAAAALADTFAALRTPLALTATDIEAGSQVVLHCGRLLPAVRATCAIPGGLPPERIDGRWLVDGGVVNLLPVDVAWMADPDLVIAVRVGGPRVRRMPQLDRKMTGWLAGLGRFLPNPITARLSFEMLVRASEILLERQTALCAAMTDPEVLIEPELGDIGLRDFGRLDEAVAAGRRATEAVLPTLERLLASPRPQSTLASDAHGRYVDPVCAMVIQPTRARATVSHGGTTYYFCSANCCDRFLRDPARHIDKAALSFAAGRQL